MDIGVDLGVDVLEPVSCEFWLLPQQYSDGGVWEVLDDKTDIQLWLAPTVKRKGM